MIFLIQNSYPMREWHVNHMEKTIVKFVTGLSQNPTMWEKRQHKGYGTLANCCRQIDYDIKHGVTNEEVLSLLNKIRSDNSFSKVREISGFLERLDEVEKHFEVAKPNLIYSQI